MVTKIDGLYENMTVKDYLYKVLALSSNTVKKLKQTENGITVNGTHVTVRYVLTEGDTLSLILDDTEDDVSENVVPAEFPLSIVYEDEYMIALNKPAGMPTHPSHNHHTDTLANALAYRFKISNTPFVFRAINRLDADTSGIVLVAKTRHAASKLAETMQKGGFDKAYFAIVHGRIDADGEIDLPIRRRTDSTMLRECCKPGDEKAKTALTVYKVIRQKQSGESFTTLISASPITGRTHQLRVHLSHISHPILGDGLYGITNDGSDYKRLALHCYSLGFIHPFTGERLNIAAPCDFETEF